MDAAEAFLKFYENSKDQIILNDYFKQQFQSQTPNKIQVEYNCSIESLPRTLSNTILYNLNINQYFDLKDTKIPFDYMKTFYEVIKAALVGDANENIVARLLFYLHASKSCLSKNFFIKVFLAKTDRIKICNQGESTGQWYTNELNRLYLKLIQSKKIKDVTSAVVKKVCLKSSDYDYSQLRLKYFDSEIPGLNGFAGINTIYVSENELLAFSMNLNKGLDESEMLIIMKLNFVRLVQREVTNVVIRYVTNDINVSTPDILSKSGDSIVNVEEAGLQAEIDHFGAAINWMESTKNRDFNIGYCRSYLERLEANEEATFDIEQANAVKEVIKPSLIAVDMQLEEDNFIFE